MPRSRRLALNVLVAVAILVGLELLCRAGEHGSKYAWSEPYGYRLAPGYDSGHETVNAAGLRGAELRPRVPGRVRILAMGASTTWGHKVDDDETWPFALQEALARRTGRDVEVLNAGVSGWGLEQMVLALRTEYLADLDPDLVLVYAGWNHATLDDNPQVAKYRAYAPLSEEKPGLFHSALVRWLQDALGSSAAVAAGDELPMEERLARRRRIQELMADAFPRLYGEVAQLAREHRIPIVVLRYPGLMTVPPDVGAGTDEAYAELLRHDRHAALAFDELVRDAAAQYDGALAVIDGSAATAGLPVLDLGGAMVAALPADAVERREAWAAAFRDRMHLTPAGNARIGEALAELLVTGGFVAPDESR